MDHQAGVWSYDTGAKNMTSLVGENLDETVGDAFDLAGSSISEIDDRALVFDLGG